ncbi:hypothetical protein M378DRAFT_170393 [Amanita muscaria Koide BX008]|uniref:2-(3-amino-3-carboxypropyl)histidine synthase subunit 2 n=1 Tax=Amanita muscaria (strain Koide BX008) TaxID=946122 RepID=A0A0C2WBE0_AMAMK|nr:hypothetical protein M378DRAFT_170393 [Amanita muscaria Koide BX008]
MTATVSAFSATGQDAITHTIDVQRDASADNLPAPEFNAYFEIEETAEEIRQSDYKRIALQFPDELLHNSVPIHRELMARIGNQRKLYVLADTSYGSCCVDEVAAQHVDADAIVHYGYACMSQTSRLPVIHVFGKKTIDTEHCVQAFLEAIKSNSELQGETHVGPILLRHDVAFTYRAEELVNNLREALEPLGLILQYTKPRARSIPTSLDPTSSSQALDSSAHYPTILYVGSESLGLTNLLITNVSSTVISYNPISSSTRIESARTNKLLMRRYVMVQKARDADVFGILVGTLGVASYLPLIKHLRAFLAQKQKKSYTICVGKLNPAKLANFLEIECFVLVACPENSLMDAKDFFRPIVTPYELEIALQATQSWTGRYVLDFNQVLAESKDGEAKEDTGEDGPEDPERPMFSLVTGTYRHVKKYGAETGDANRAPADETAVILRNQEGQLTSTLQNNAAAQFLQNRIYRGLDPRIEQDLPGILELGRSGVARGYNDDHKSGG